MFFFKSYVVYRMCYVVRLVLNLKFSFVFLQE